MQRFVRCAGLLVLALSLCVPTMRAGQDKKADDPKQDSKKVDDPKQDSKKADDPKQDSKKTGGYVPDLKDKDKLKDRDKLKPDWVFDFAGKLAALADNDDQGITFTVQVSYKYPELNPDAQRQIAQQQQNLLQQQVQFAQAKSLQQRQSIVGQIANTQRELEKSVSQLYRLKDVNFDVKCRAADDMRVRRFEPPLPVDPETGEFVKLTKEKLVEARGKEGYPGYKADSKILANGQIVNIYLWKDTKTPATFLDKSKLAKMKVDEVKAELKNFRYDVIMVYVVVDAPSAKDKN